MHQVVRTLVREHHPHHALIVLLHVVTPVSQPVHLLVKDHQVVAAEIAHQLVLQDVVHRVAVLVLLHVVVAVLMDVALHVEVDAREVVLVLVVLAA